MLALVAGTGALPTALIIRLIARGEPVLICEMAGFEPELPPEASALPRIPVRIEHLGSILDGLPARGVTHVCLAGAMRRPPVDPAALDGATAPLVPRLMAALAQGDDGLLRTIVSLFEERGLSVVGAADIAPDLLPPPGVATSAAPAFRHRALAALGEATVAEMGRTDTGQACVLGQGGVIAREGPDGTDAMLGALPRGAGQMLFKAPKPGQERRVDLPVVGPDTADAAARAGLDGIVIEAGGVMVLDLPRLVRMLDTSGLYLWVRPAGEA